MGINRRSAARGARPGGRRPGRDTTASERFQRWAERVDDEGLGALDPGLLERVELCRLRQPKLVWLNAALLRELGILGPAEQISPALEAEVLRACAWSTPPAGQPTAVEPQTRQAFVADRYGGPGVGDNEGSGRAAARGRLQLKGIGATPLASQATEFDHRHGGLALEEALREAIWSEINHHALPYGANRVLAIVDAGCKISWPDGSQEHRAVAARPFPLRPGHYCVNALAPRLASLRRQVTRLRRGTAGPRGLDARLADFAGRLGTSLASSWVRRLHHGALTPSNVELSGAFLDFGAQTATPDHGAATFKDQQVLDPSKVAETVLRPFFENVLLLWPARPPLGASYAHAQETFRSHYGTRLAFEFVCLTGVPVPLLEETWPEPADVELATSLQSLAALSAEPTSVDKQMPAAIGDFDVCSLVAALQGLVRAPAGTAEELVAGLAERADRGAQQKLAAVAGAHRAWWPRVVERAQAAGHRPDVFAELAFRAAQHRGQPRPLLYRPQLKQRNIQLIDQYLVNLDPAPLARWVDQVVLESRRDFDSRSLSRTVIHEWPDPYGGGAVSYELETGRGFVLRLRTPARGSRLFGLDTDAGRLSLGLERFDGSGAQVWAEFQEGDAGFEARVDLTERVMAVSLPACPAEAAWHRVGLSRVALGLPVARREGPRIARAAAQARAFAPGRIVRTAREALRLNVAALAGELGLAAAALEEIEEGQQEISAPLAERLEAVLGVHRELLLTLRGGP